MYAVNTTPPWPVAIVAIRTVRAVELILHNREQPSPLLIIRLGWSRVHLTWTQNGHVNYDVNNDVTKTSHGLNSSMDAVSELLRTTDFAARKHKNQRRKNEEAHPYINHPIGVANILANEGGVTDLVVLQVRSMESGSQLSKLILNNTYTLRYVSYTYYFILAFRVNFILFSC